MLFRLECSLLVILRESWLDHVKTSWAGRGGLGVRGKGTGCPLSLLSMQVTLCFLWDVGSIMAVS